MLSAPIRVRELEEDAALRDNALAFLESFGDFGEGYLRVSYANSIENIEFGLASLRTLLENSLVS